MYMLLLISLLSPSLTIFAFLIPVNAVLRQAQRMLIKMIMKMMFHYVIVRLMIQCLVRNRFVILLNCFLDIDSHVMIVQSVPGSVILVT